MNIKTERPLHGQADVQDLVTAHLFHVMSITFCFSHDTPVAQRFSPLTPGFFSMWALLSLYMLLEMFLSKITVWITSSHHSGFSKGDGSWEKTGYPPYLHSCSQPTHSSVYELFVPFSWYSWPIWMCTICLCVKDSFVNHVPAKGWSAACGGACL